MPTRNVNLTDHLDTFLDRQTTEGRYKHASEVVRAGLRLLELQERAEEAKLDALRHASALGIEAYASSNFTPILDDQELERFFDEIAQEAENA